MPLNDTLRDSLLLKEASHVLNYNKVLAYRFIVRLKEYSMYDTSLYPHILPYIPTLIHTLYHPYLPTLPYPYIFLVYIGMNKKDTHLPSYSNTFKYPI